MTADAVRIRREDRIQRAEFGMGTVGQVFGALERWSQSQTIDYRVLAKADVGSEAVGHGEKALTVGLERRGIRAAEGGEFADLSEVSLVPAKDLGLEVGLRSRGRALDEADTDEVQRRVGVDQLEFAAPRPAETLVGHELTATPNDTERIHRQCWRRLA